MAVNSVDKSLTQAPTVDDVMLEQFGPIPSDLFPEDGATVEIDIQPTDDDGAEIFFGPEPAAPLGEEPVDFFDNLVDNLTDDTKVGISAYVMSTVEEDKSSREDWEDTYVKGLELLGMKYEDRTQPFEGSTGVVHPVLNEAVTQFQAAAYKEMLPSAGPVRAQLIGQQTNKVEKQAQRVQDYMNYMLMHEMDEYEPEFDQMLYFLGLGGSAFKKVYMDEMLGRPVSKFVPSEDVIVNYTATDLQSAERVTHVITISANELKKMQINGVYTQNAIVQRGDGQESDDVQQAYDDLQGIQSSYNDNEFTLYESHCYLDVEEYADVDANGDETGIKLPYIVTICKETNEVLSLRRNYRPNDLRKSKIPHFVQYKFTPGLGFYGFGLIHLLGNLSRTATSNLRQLIDAGTLANMPSGFKARGMRISDEETPLNPGEFRDVDVPGGDLSGSLVPLPFKEPSGTLFQLMGFVIEAAQRFVGTTDMGMGNIANNNGDMPVGTTIALLERGSRVISAVHKRLHASMKQELKMLARLFAEDPQPYPYQINAEDAIKATDFDDRVDILPVSDPNIFSMSQRVVLAQEQLQLAQSSPAMHNMYEAYKRVYEALGVKDIEQILKNTDSNTPTDPMSENLLASKAVDGVVELKAFIEQDHDAHIAVHQLYMQTAVVQQQPKIALVLEKHIYEHISMKAQIMAKESVNQVQGEVPVAQYEAQLARIQSQLMMEYQQQNPPAQQQGEQDPLVQLKQQELQLRQQDLQAKQQLAQAELQLDQQQLAMKEQDQQADRMMDQEKLNLDREKFEQDKINKSVGG
tara:strand:+ start:1660 stop:4071 length:2412 start_codon:yes stop_codon:yes gene_type:complete